MSEVTQVVQRLVGLKCWHCFIRSGSSTLSMAFGQKLPRKSKLAASKDESDPRRYEGELSLFIECTWRLDGPESIVTVWSEADTDLEGGPISKGMREIYGRIITSVEVTRPAWDMVLHFKGGYCLRVFCDTTDLQEEQDAWSLSDYNSGLLVSVGPKGRWSTDRNLPHNTWSGSD